MMKDIVLDEAEEFSSMVEKHSRHDRTVWSKIESNDDDIDSVDGNLGRKKKSSLHTNKPTMKVNEVLCNDIEISPELYRMHGYTESRIFFSEAKYTRKATHSTLSIYLPSRNPNR